MAGDRPRPEDRGRPQGPREVHPARRSAVCERPPAHRPRAEQDPQGRHQPVPAHGRQADRLRAGLGLPRPADRVEDRGGLPGPRPEQGRRADRRVPPGVPGVRRQVDRRPARRVQAARRDRAVGPAVPDHDLSGRGADRARARQVPDERRALQGRPPGHVVGGREDRAGRRRDRVSRPRLDHDPRPLPCGEGLDPGARGRDGGDLDDHPLDHAGQPGRRLWRRDRLRGGRGDGGRREQPGQGRREAGLRGRPAGRLQGPGQDRGGHRAGTPEGRRVGRHDLRAPAARPRLRLRRADAGRRLRDRRDRHRLRA